MTCARLHVDKDVDIGALASQSERSSSSGNDDVLRDSDPKSSSDNNGYSIGDEQSGSITSKGSR
jgi:hypothetical protein